MSPDVAASVKARLLNEAKKHGESFELFLVRYACERFLYRLGASDLRERCTLKGAGLLALWMEELEKRRDMLVSTLREVWRHSEASFISSLSSQTEPWRSASLMRGKPRRGRSLAQDTVASDNTYQAPVGQEHVEPPCRVAEQRDQGETIRIPGL